MRAGAWTLAGFGLRQIIRFGSNLLMTRLLLPEMFGVMAVATMVMVGLAMFSDMGLRQNVIRSHRGEDPLFLDTVWVVQILRGGVLWLCAVIVAAGLAFANGLGLFRPESVYAVGNLPYVIAVVSASVVISGFESTKILQASRNLSLARLTQIDIAAQVGGLACMLAWVLVDRSIWALAAGGIAASFFRTALSHYLLSGTSNRWRWDSSALKEIFGFGKWVFISSILGFMLNNGDRILLGGLVSSGALGTYVIAYMIYQAVDQVITKVIGDVVYPTLSEVVRERPKELKRYYYRFYTATATVCYLSAGFLFVSGATVIGFLYDSRYEDAGWMLQILILTLIVSPMHIANHCLMALGLPRLFSLLIAVQLVALFLFLPLGFRYGGLPGAVSGVVLSNFACLPLTLYFSNKHGFLDLKKELLLLPMIGIGMAIGYSFIRAIAG